MAFCNSCGASLVPGTRFCNKCGSPITASTPAPAASPTATAPAATPTPGAPTTGGSSAIKIILIVVGVIVLIGVLGVASVSYFVYHVAKSARTHVHEEGGKVKVETPFGNVETSSDPEQAAKDIGIDIYPGAQVQKDGTSTATLGSIHTVTANFVSSDSVEKVCAFYKSRFSNAMVSTSDQNRCTFVSNDQKNMITINVESSSDGSKLQITNVSKKN